MKYPEARILVFCKAPVTGKVMSRLSPVLDECGRVRLHKHLSARLLDACLASELAPVELWCAPDTGHAFFRHYQRLGIRLRQQEGVDIGERMFRGARSVLSDPVVDKVLIVGTDCPDLDPDYLEQALVRLQDQDAVLGPAEDGGYGLIGLRKVEAGIFSDIAWSTSAVCRQTCIRFDAAGYRWSWLPRLWDIDRPEDLERYRSGLYDTELEKASCTIDDGFFRASRMPADVESG